MERQYVSSERAHFMCPKMHFGILVEIKSKLSFEKAEQCIQRLSKAHPFLRSLIQYESGNTRLFYDIKEASTVLIYKRNSIETLWEDYQEIGKRDWDVFHNGLLKVFLYPKGDEMEVLFVAHHLLADGRGLANTW